MWQRTQQLRHPNLLELLNCGRAEPAGEIALYAVFESPGRYAGIGAKQSPSPKVKRGAGRSGGCLGILQGCWLPRLIRNTSAVGIDCVDHALQTPEVPDSVLRAFWHKISPCTLARGYSGEDPEDGL
jgi:hypothetical protein